ncbi:MAG: DUF3048 domain-containing protein [Acidimicrobiales bacterium]
MRRSQAVLLVGVATASLALTACGSPARPAAAPTTTTTKPAASPNGPKCPLTGEPAPFGKVPQRPALAVKVDDFSAARPQSGLDHADIIFEEPVEGGITRYVAVFQCQDASLVGPIRSARNIDIGILGEFGRPLLANVGGIQPVLDNIENSPILENDLRIHGAVVQHPPGRFAPYDTYATTSALWALQPNQNAAPSPVFTYSKAAPVGTQNASVSIPYPGSNVVWTYDSGTKQYLRSYGAIPDNLNGGPQNSAANVIVQTVQVTYGPWLENDVGGLEVQANLYESASGPAEIFRNGVEITGTWQRDALGQPTQFISSTGVPITLQSGQTWVELVPSTIAVTATP